MSNLAEKKKLLELMNLETNIMKLEVRLLELDEEKEKLNNNIEEHKQRLVELKGE